MKLNLLMLGIGLLLQISTAALASDAKPFSLGQVLSASQVQIGAMATQGLSCPEGFVQATKFDKRAPFQQALACTPKPGTTNDIQRIFISAVAEVVEGLEMNLAPKKFQCTADSMIAFLKNYPITKEPTTNNKDQITFEFKVADAMDFWVQCEPKNNHLWIRVSSGFSELIKECTKPPCDTLDFIPGLVLELADQEGLAVKKRTRTQQEKELKEWIGKDFKPRLAKLKKQAAKMSKLNQQIFERFSKLALDLNVLCGLYERAARPVE